LIKKYNFDIDAEHLDIGRPSLGLYPTNKMVMTAKEDREKMNNSKAIASTIPISPSSRQEEEGHRFEYVFLVACCKPKSPTYRGYLYNIAIAKYLLAEFNSTADVVTMIRMHADTDETALPPEDEALLTKSGVIVKYIPKPLTDNFHTAMMDKFRVLELTEYTRVLYLDADVMPLNNLDYMFAKSVGANAQLEENVVLSFNNEPASGGFFMLTPNAQDYEEVTKIALNRENTGYEFDETVGFGHEIVPPDHWESFERNGTKWDFYGAFTVSFLGIKTHAM
jgi:alpha-N-acetylglucosamine transferase